MDFGRVAEYALTDINFDLPNDGHFTQQILTGSHVQPTKFFVGCQSMSKDAWIGAIFRKGTKKKDMNSQYVATFNSVDYLGFSYNNDSFTETESFLANCKIDPDKEFLFFPRISNKISHTNRLVNVDEINSRFTDLARIFGNNLGGCYLQMSGTFGVDSWMSLKTYVESFPKDIKLFVEMRAEDWFKKSLIRNQYFQLLSDLEIGTVISDTPGRRDVLHMELTTPELFVRFDGTGRRSNYHRIDEWVKRIELWIDNGLRQVNFFVSEPDESKTPALAQYVISQFNQHLNASLQNLEFCI
ncbi:DUF72 domain-containing protein [Pedobacter duraquae]|uniref:Uncharacterized protein YecE (DUF72 family) n=1 Tax=Pedobacter duraquae TaxID=425511 RepID=A0A4R6IAW7_9SPHI|nr:DUF72 domain-containing protein [Pedobacter duraquae]TDO19363.1 uncharacterized protein YecE (DUF72 family) [Pedobacter duraquae]